MSKYSLYPEYSRPPTGQGVFPDELYDELEKGMADRQWLHDRDVMLRVPPGGWDQYDVREHRMLRKRMEEAAAQEASTQRNAEAAGIQRNAEAARIQARAASIPNMSAGALSYPELREQAQSLLAKDQMRQGNTPYLPYPGATQAPMSALTQKSRQYQQEFAGKGVPFANKNRTIANRSKEGFSPQAQQQILDMMRQGQTTFNQGAEKQFGKRFGASLPYIQDDLNRKGIKDLNRGLDTAGGNLRNVGRAAADIDQRQNQGITSLFQALGQEKQARRKDLTNTLDEFGKQKHAHSNMQIEADRNKFNQEVNRPYQKMGLLQQLINGQGAGVNAGDDLHPDIASARGKELQQGLQAYGIDPSKPVAQWDSSRTSQPSYPGQRVAALNPQLEAAYETMERIGPKTRDVNYNQTKAGIRGLLDSGNISEQALASLPAEMRESLQRLDIDAGGQRKQQLRGLSNMYAQLRQHGSGAHMKAAAEMERALEKNVMAEREKLYRSNIDQQLDYRRNQGENAIKNTLQSAQVGSADYHNLMNDIRNTHKIGQNIFNNEQDEQDQLYKNYQNEWAHQWPQLRGAAAGAQGYGGGAIGAMGMEAPLNRQNFSHSEVNKAPMQVQPPFVNTQTAKQSLLGNPPVQVQQEQINWQLAQYRAAQQILNSGNLAKESTIPQPGQMLSPYHLATNRWQGNKTMAQQALQKLGYEGPW